MNPEIKHIGSKLFVGVKQTMSLSHNQTFEIWQHFMSSRKAVRDTINNDLYSLQIYPDSYFENFNPNSSFEKWALTEVSAIDDIPQGMEAFILNGGLYAVFFYRGASAEAEQFFRYIFNTWLPASGYELDNRPHFEILGDKYRNESPDSEEEIWIPVRIRHS